MSGLNCHKILSDGTPKSRLESSTYAASTLLNTYFYARMDRDSPRKKNQYVCFVHKTIHMEVCIEDRATSNRMSSHAPIVIHRWIVCVYSESVRFPLLRLFVELINHKSQHTMLIKSDPLCKISLSNCS